MLTEEMFNAYNGYLLCNEIPQITPITQINNFDLTFTYKQHRNLILDSNSHSGVVLLS